MTRTASVCAPLDSLGPAVSKVRRRGALGPGQERMPGWGKTLKPWAWTLEGEHAK